MPSKKMVAPNVQHKQLNTIVGIATLAFLLFSMWEIYQNYQFKKLEATGKK